jgi:hypothetical protein
MTNILNPALREVTRLTRAGRLTEATAALQRILSGDRAAPVIPRASASSAARHTPLTIDGVAEPVEATRSNPVRQSGAEEAREADRWRFSAATGTEQIMPEEKHHSVQRGVQGGLNLPGGVLAGRFPSASRVPVPDGAQFLAATLSNRAGSP